ncbi:uncharacterized protein [Montipora foliosa]|uniref:uncharacterized protein isoform X3 n=1 Tax=Montipora foliosa TaxID=591990 RepID=UPI0035F1AEA1
MAEDINVEVIVKLGGCAVTHKGNFETVKHEAIEAAAKVVKEIKGKCIVIHGAGSFGHFQAHEYGTANGFSEDHDKSCIGFAKTRQSVTKLQHMITEVFIANGIPAVGISPCGSWLTGGGVVTRSAVQPLVELIAEGFVPILHGDCVLDSEQGCAILSGDKIIEKLVEELHPSRVVFLTDVDGIYDKPPSNEGATLLRRVSVKPNGKLTIAIETSALTHDVTGGVWEKLRTASNIVLISEGQTRVFVGNIMSETVAYSVCVLGVLENERGFILKSHSLNQSEICDKLS